MVPVDRGRTDTYADQILYISAGTTLDIGTFIE